MHFGRRSWSLTRVKTCDEHDSKWPEDWSVNVQIFRDSTRKQWHLDGKHWGLNHKGNDVKGPHANAQKWRITQEATGRKPNWDEMGPGRSVQAGQPSPFRARFCAPFELATIQTIYSPPTKSDTSIHSSSTAEEQIRKGHHSGEEGRDGWLGFPLPVWKPCMEDHVGVPGAMIKIEVGSWWWSCPCITSMLN
jgi:hypothetical protein